VAPPFQDRDVFGGVCVRSATSTCRLRLPSSTPPTLRPCSEGERAAPTTGAPFESRLHFCRPPLPATLQMQPACAQVPPLTAADLPNVASAMLPQCHLPAAAPPGRSQARAAAREGLASSRPLRGPSYFFGNLGTLIWELWNFLFPNFLGTLELELFFPTFSRGFSNFLPPSGFGARTVVLLPETLSGRLQSAVCSGPWAWGPDGFLGVRLKAKAMCCGEGIHRGFAPGLVGRKWRSK